MHKCVSSIPKSFLNFPVQFWRFKRERKRGKRIFLYILYTEKKFVSFFLVRTSNGLLIQQLSLSLSLFSHPFLTNQAKHSFLTGTHIHKITNMHMGFQNADLPASSGLNSTSSQPKLLANFTILLAILITSSLLFLNLYSI